MRSLSILHAPGARLLLAAALVLGAALTATPKAAKADVFIGVPGIGVYIGDGRRYYDRPRYYAPRPYYAPHYYAPPRRFVRPGRAYRHGYRQGYRDAYRYDGPRYGGYRYRDHW